jgi:hypothetical protein
MPPRSQAWIGLVSGCALALAAGLPGLELPGLYYDEVIQAEPALAFLRGEPPRVVPGLRTLPGTTFPWMTQPYMGAFKSQVLVPVFALFEPSSVSLRATTFGLGLAGLVLWTLFAYRVFGATVAAIAALLLASDPSFLFIARHDWGSFSLGLLLRGGALLGLLAGYRRGSPVAGFAGGACLGLGLYNKVDFAVFLLAAAVALGIVARDEIRGLLARRPHWLTAAGLGFALGLAPLAAALPDVLRSTVAFGGASAGFGEELGQKLVLTLQVLDGSYFHRLMLMGGDFLALETAVDPARSLGAIAVAIAGIGLALGTARGRAISQPRAVRGLLVCTLACFVALLLLPRAVRIHHTLNAWPLPQLVVACAIAELARRRGVPRAAALALVLCLVASNLRVDGAIHETLNQTQGRGRWSQAIAAIAQEDSPGPIVALDWGFAGPLHFTRPELEIQEPIWALRAPRPPQQGLSLSGTPAHRYLFFEPQHAVFPFGAALLRAAEALPARRVEVIQHHDASGAPVFREVRFRDSHTLVHRGDRFEVRFE